jgi:YD repeat-containing protein
VHLEELRDKDGNLLRKTETTWEVGTNKVPRMARTEVTDERSQKLATSYQQYNDDNGPGRVIQYDYSGAVLRTTLYTYTSYMDTELETPSVIPMLSFMPPRRINLVQTEKIYDGDDATNKLAALTEYKYDERSNLVSHTDARGVRTEYKYAGDPLNRLQDITYDTSRVNTLQLTVAPAPNVHFSYRAKTTASQARDVTQVESVTTRHQNASQDFNTESYVYDTLGRVEKKTLAFAARSSTFETSFAYDTLGRLKKLTYPKQYAAGVPAPASKAVEYGFGADGRINAVSVDGAGLATDVKYGADGQLTDLSLGADATKTNETYVFDPRNGLLVNQKVRWANNPQARSLLNLTYGYQLTYSVNPIGVAPDTDRKAYTGQVTRVSATETGAEPWTLNYSYDSLNRLRQVREDVLYTCYAYGCAPGQTELTPRWAEDYAYDMFGNRTRAALSYFSFSSENETSGGGLEAEGLTYSVETNRQTAPGFVYDAAGNLTQGAGRSYVYDAANRLSNVKQGSVTLESYAYGASNQRLINFYGDEGVPAKTYNVWNGGAVIAEYAETDASPTSPQWAKNYVYMGGTLLSSQEPATPGGEYVRYYHPDQLGPQLVTNASDTTYIHQRTLPTARRCPPSRRGPRPTGSSHATTAARRQGSITR